MSKEDVNVTGASAQAPVKKNRRGVSNQTKAVNQLRFHEKDASPANGLFIGHLESVSVEWSVNAEGKVFTGMKVPRILIHAASNHTNANEQRHVYYNINPIESNIATIPGGTEEWKVNNMFNWMKHILDVFYLKGRTMTEEEENALSLPFEDFDENGEYISVEPEDVLAGYRFIFENFVAMMNGQFGLKEGEVAKPCYKTADGKILPTWMKLLRHKKVKNEWKDVAQNGELGFDPFIGNGVFELVKKDVMPVVLRIDFAKESITPKETKKTPTIGIPGMSTPNMGGVMPGGPIDTGANWNQAAMDASGEMPF